MLLYSYVPSPSGLFWGWWATAMAGASITVIRRIVLFDGWPNRHIVRLEFMCSYARTSICVNVECVWRCTNKTSGQTVYSNVCTNVAINLWLTWLCGSVSEQIRSSASAVRCRWQRYARWRVRLCVCVCRERGRKWQGDARRIMASLSTETKMNKNNNNEKLYFHVANEMQRRNMNRILLIYGRVWPTYFDRWVCLCVCVRVWCEWVYASMSNVESPGRTGRIPSWIWME